MAFVDSEPLRFMWCELTSRCQLACAHCYAESGPEGDHGCMTALDWCRVLEEAAALGARDVQFIGGEPTLHPDLPALLRHALDLGLGVEVYTNLARAISQELWDIFELPRVRLATSYYAADPAVHDSITTRRGSHKRTRANIAEARQHGIPLRVGIVAISDDQAVEEAVADMRSLGVEDVGADHLRQVGRGVRDRKPDVDQLCGHCADGKLTVAPSGDVWLCPFARWLVIGNVEETPLADLQLRAAPLRRTLRRQFAARRLVRCSPDDGNPCGGPVCKPNIPCDPDSE